MSAGENHRPAALGQIFADMHGWQELADDMTGIVRALPADVRGKIAIFASNYGEAAAIDVLAPSGVLPPVISGHNQYFLWGPRGWDGSALLDVGADVAADKELCGSAIVVGTLTAPWVMPYENDLPIVLCRDLRPPVAKIWPSLKHFE